MLRCSVSVCMRLGLRRGCIRVGCGFHIQTRCAARFGFASKTAVGRWRGAGRYRCGGYPDGVGWTLAGWGGWMRFGDRLKRCLLRRRGFQTTFWTVRFGTLVHLRRAGMPASFRRSCGWGKRRINRGWRTTRTRVRPDKSGWCRRVYGVSGRLAFDGRYAGRGCLGRRDGGAVCCVLFQNGVERSVVHGVSFERRSAITDDDHRTAVFIVVIRARIAPCKSAAFACCRCFNGARGIAQLLIQPSIKLFSALQFALLRPCCPAIVLAYRVEEYG